MKSLIGERAYNEFKGVPNCIHDKTQNVRLIVDTGCKSLIAIVLKELDKEKVAERPVSSTVEAKPSPPPGNA
jgi:hypothetical protein